VLEVALGVVIFALGASVGSFLNVVADRLPSGQSLVSPRSHCPNCERLIPNRELIPVLSYLWLRGKCRECGAQIPQRILWVEIVTGLLFVGAYLRFDYSVTFLIVAAAVALLVVIAIIDLEHKLILNRIVLPSIVVALVVAPFWNELGIERSLLGETTLLSSFANSAVAGIGAFAFFFVILLIFPQGMGGGDVKMAGLLGVMLGFPGVAVAIVGAIVAGGAIAVTLVLFRGRGRKDAIPFGPFLSAGGLVALVGGGEIFEAYISFVEGLVIT